jgi:hypothetical protein
MTADQWVAAIIAVVSGIAIRIIDRYWPDLGRKEPSGGASNPPGD